MLLGSKHIENYKITKKNHIKNRYDMQSTILNSLENENKSVDRSKCKKNPV
mgnify:CR=1 FL=1